MAGNEKTIPKRRPALPLRDAFVPPPSLLFPGLVSLEDNIDDISLLDTLPHQDSSHLYGDPVDRITRLIEQSVGPRTSRTRNPENSRSDLQTSTIATESIRQANNETSYPNRASERRGGGHLPTSRRHRQHHTLPRNAHAEYTILARPQISQIDGPSGTIAATNNSTDTTSVHIPTSHHHQQRQLNTQSIHHTFSIRNKREDTQTHSLDGEIAQNTTRTTRRAHIPNHKSNPQLRATALQMTSIATPVSSNLAQFAPESILSRPERSNTWNGGANRFASNLRIVQAQTDHSFAMERWIRGKDRVSDPRRLQRAMETELSFSSWNEVQLPAGPLSDRRIRGIEMGIIGIGGWIDEGGFDVEVSAGFSEEKFMMEDCIDYESSKILIDDD